MNINESSEMYLETILKLSEHNDCVRSIDIARQLNYSRPSVNKAINVLKTKGLITHQPYGAVCLTSMGIEKAKAIFERHVYIKRFLEETLDIKSEIADEDACKIEHIISETTFQAVKKYFSK